MSSITINTQSDLLKYLKSEAINRKLRIRGLARLCGIADKSLINRGDFNNTKLAKVMRDAGFNAADIIKNGFSGEACWIIIDYYAYKSRASAEGAKKIVECFGYVGFMDTFNQLPETTVLFDTPVKHIEPKIKTDRDAIDYIEATAKLHSLSTDLPDGIVNHLLGLLSQELQSLTAIAPAPVPNAPPEPTQQPLPVVVEPNPVPVKQTLAPRDRTVWVTLVEAGKRLGYSLDSSDIKQLERLIGVNLNRHRITRKKANLGGSNWVYLPGKGLNYVIENYFTVNV